MEYFHNTFFSSFIFGCIFFYDNNCITCFSVEEIDIWGLKDSNIFYPKICHFATFIVLN